MVLWAAQLGLVAALCSSDSAVQVMYTETRKLDCFAVAVHALIM